MNSYLGLAVACPSYFTHKKPTPSVVVTMPKEVAPPSDELPKLGQAGTAASTPEQA
jgi:hypothetical protein